jgi:hypothetical protein
MMILTFVFFRIFLIHGCPGRGGQVVNTTFMIEPLIFLIKAQAPCSSSTAHSPTSHLRGTQIGVLNPDHLGSAERSRFCKKGKKKQIPDLNCDSNPLSDTNTDFGPRVEQNERTIVESGTQTANQRSATLSATAPHWQEAPSKKQRDPKNVDGMLLAAHPLQMARTHRS